MTKSKQVIQTFEKYVMNTYARNPVVFAYGEGACLFDMEDKRYLDMLGGIAVCSLGHSHPKVVKAMEEQAKKLIHVSNLYYTEPQGLLARELVARSCFDKAFFCNSGAEANESALKLTRKYFKRKGEKDRIEVITMQGSFHGRTLQTLSATGQEKVRKDYDPLSKGFKYAEFNNLDSVKELIGPETAAVMLEPVQGESGVKVAETAFLQGLEALAKKHGFLLIFDEVQTGLGRTGKMFGYMHSGVEPDIMTLAKSLAGGLPIGVMLANDKTAKAFEPGDHASTFGGGPVVCATALQVLKLLDDKMLKRINDLGDKFREKLRELAKTKKRIKEVRGLGLMIGVGLDGGAKEVNQALFEKGILGNAVGDHSLRFLPPFVITPGQIDMVIRALDEIL